MSIEEKQKLIDFYISSNIFSKDTKWVLISNLLGL